MLRCALAEMQDHEWDQLLPYIEMFYNGTPSASTNKSPHEIVFGSTIRLPMEAFNEETQDETEMIVPTVE